MPFRSISDYLSQKAKDILKKAPTIKELDRISEDEAKKVLNELRDFKKEVSHRDNPDYFTATFIEIQLDKKINGKK